MEGNNKKQEQLMKKATSLVLALMNDFRGFILEDGKEIEVKDEELHALVAKRYLLENDSEYEYTSGVGQDAILDLLARKKAIYITRIPTLNNEYQRTVAYVREKNMETIEYKRQERVLADVLQEISLGMGYFVEERTAEEIEVQSEEGTKKILSGKIRTIEAKIKKKSTINLEPKVSRSPDDKAVFGENGKILGYMHNGRYYSATHYNILQGNNPKQSEADENNGGTGDGR